VDLHAVGQLQVTAPLLDDGALVDQRTPQVAVVAALEDVVGDEFQGKGPGTSDTSARGVHGQGALIGEGVARQVDGVSVARPGPLAVARERQGMGEIELA
jgi:hypothetical protein